MLSTNQPLVVLTLDEAEKLVHALKTLGILASPHIRQWLDDGTFRVFDELGDFVRAARRKEEEP